MYDILDIEPYFVLNIEEMGKSTPENYTVSHQLHHVKMNIF